MGQKLKNEIKEFKLLLKSVPAVILTLFVLSVFSMNLLANKSINLSVSWLALDCGIVVSWFAFLTMDILTKHFGPKASTQISILAITINLAFCLLLFMASKVSGTWGESYVEGSENLINSAINKTFGGTWYVLFGSTLAFIASAFVNNFVNFGASKLFKNNPDGGLAYFFRSYVSTAVGQFADNLIFALVVSHIFFGWTMLQCFMCALTGMVVELICEVVFSYFGFSICRRWKKEGVGSDYFEYIKTKSENVK